MNSKVKENLEAAIIANAKRSAAPLSSALEAMQFAQASANAANALIGIVMLERAKEDDRGDAS